MAMMNLNAEGFEKIVTEGKPALVEFWAPWCVYCRRIAPALGKVAEQYSEQLTIAQVNIDEEPDIAKKEQIEVVPTMLLFKDGKVQGSIVAPESKAKIEEFLKEHGVL